jgi:hypothetical protein
MRLKEFLGVIMLIALTGCATSNTSTKPATLLGPSLILLAGGADGDLLTRVVEPVTGIAFPFEVRFSQDTEDYTLHLTGAAAYKKWFLKVYAIAHYLQTPKGAGPLDRKKILTDGPAKQMTIQFARNVSAQTITKILRGDFELNTTPSEYREIKTYVDQMLAFFAVDVFILCLMAKSKAMRKACFLRVVCGPFGPASIPWLILRHK